MIMLMISVYSRSRRTGGRTDTVPVLDHIGPGRPKTRTKRPPERSSSVAAVAAMTPGEREKVLKMPAPTLIRVVAMTNSVSRATRS